eukprot:Skav232274  [mRNA]  locus=scaffold882:177193:177420:+ [translate_table: standard]
MRYGHLFFLRRVRGMDIASDVLGLCLDQRQCKVSRVPARDHRLNAIHRMPCLVCNNPDGLAPVLRRQFFDPWLIF